MMRSGLIWSVVVVVDLALAASADAQTTQKTNCGWVDGVYACSSRIETERSITDTVCGYGANAACSTISREKKPVYRAPSREDASYSVSDEDRKAAVRKASGYRDPPGTRELR